MTVRRLPLLVLYAVLCGVLCAALSACGLVFAGAGGDGMLSAADLYGARPEEVSGVHPPLVPAPCASEPFRGDGDRLDTRAITASVAPGGGDRRFQVYEYVADYRPGGAQAYLDELGERLGRCRDEADRYSLVARDVGVPGTMLVQHDYREGGVEKTGVYLVGRAGDRLVSVLESTAGDATLVNEIGVRALRRAGATGEATPSVVTHEDTTRWVAYAVSVISEVRVSRDGRVLTLDTRVPDGPDGCLRGPTGRLDGFEPKLVHVDIRFESRLLTAGNGCPGERTVPVEVRLPKPLGKRDVVVNLDQRYTLDRPGLLRRCGELGCHPAPTGCTSDSYYQAAGDADAPEHSYHRERGCDGKWLVMDISISGGPVCERPGECAGASRTTRYFYRATPAGWRVITATTGPGCDDVLVAEPRFPRELCAKLTAP
ncbi:hypothetical protein GCM10010116_56180 [Microbispora rosea subsp. aerata]|nr:hypothetical protein [Microbispora rosea]GGO28020.1 hypothetical protein GCM10010116_56180 [Microbispora rosea subsp. aerata]GIH56165.1 hypothetical protein Mro02_30790 [Microbispora rosea subsp. aerata]GLJ85730.1 hypothetical protein GCM10017588_44630 [Microbispora rosea subsp. aerata]